MKKIKSKINAFFKDDLFTNNRAAAYARNKKTLTTVLTASMCCYILLLIASYISYAYVQSRTSYIIGIVIFLVLIVMLRHMKDTGATMLAYVIHYAFVAYCTYNSAIVWPGDICVMILAETFIVSTLFLDKAWRVFFITISSGTIYLMVISFFKTPFHFVDEAINILCFTLLSCIVGVFTRKTQLRNFEIIEKLRQSQEHYELAMHHSAGVMCEFDIENKCIFMTKEAAEKLEIPQKAYGVPYSFVKDGKIGASSTGAYVDFFEDIIKGSKTGTAEFEIITSSGWRWQKAHFSTIYDSAGKPILAVISFVDITEQLEEQNKLRNEAEIDRMTGVYNRNATEALVSQVLRTKNGPLAFLVIDIDNLKTINDTLGHPQGDEAIKTLANVLKERMRKNDIVGRIGGDEFIALLDGIETKMQIEDKIKRLLDSLYKIRIGEKKDYKISASIGVVLGHAGDISFTQLYAKADKALYVAKRGGKNRFAFYEDN